MISSPRPLLSILLAVAAALAAGPAASVAEADLGRPSSFGEPSEEGDWGVLGTSSALSSHASPGSGEIRIEQTGADTLGATALTDITLSGSDGSTCRIAGAKAKVAELSTGADGTLQGTGLTGAAERYENANHLPEVRCPGAVSTTLSYSSLGTAIFVRPPFGAPLYAGMHYTLGFLRHPTLPYVALGDSYSSGEGAGGYDEGAGRCHRSSSAWPRLLVEISRQRPLEQQSQLEMSAFLACSGAEIPDLRNRSRFGQPPQIKQLEALRPKFVTISIGGNDAGFGDILQACFLPFGDCLSEQSRDRGRKSGASKLQQALARIAGLEDKLAATYGEVAGVLVDPNRLVVVGYPDLVPRGSDRCEWLSETEKHRLSLLADALEDTLQAATRKAGVRYLSLSGTTAGHEMCTDQSWFVNITTRRVLARAAAKLIRSQKLQELGHPRATAQHAIAAYVAEELGLR